LVSFDGAYTPTAATWLTNTTGTEERDPVLARIGTSLGSNRFLVGWRMQTGNTFNLAVVNAAGTILDAVEVVSPNVGWGNRDDSMKPRPDGSITWLQGAAGSTALKLHRYSEAVTNCLITDLAAGTQTACNPSTNQYTQGVIVTYSAPPATGTLDVNGQSFAIGTSPQTVVLTGLPANGTPVNVTASFSADPPCNRTENALFTAPNSCAPGGTTCITPNAAIPDNDANGITSNLTSSTSATIAAVRVSVDIAHSFRGDVRIEVTHGATTVVLKVQDGNDSADNVVGTYPTTLPVSGPGSLSDFNGASAAGTWTLKVSDLFSQDTGTLNNWCVEIDGTTTDAGPGLDLPTVTSLQPSWPNPTRDAVTTIRFGLPAVQHVSLRIYDLTGRLVRTLFEGESPAGYRNVRWDGLDHRGRRVTPGIYLYRLNALPDALTGRLIVVR
jgi:subtilisin-like proprotein convertase family protein